MVGLLTSSGPLSFTVLPMTERFPHQTDSQVTSFVLAVKVQAASLRTAGFSAGGREQPQDAGPY